MPCYAQAVPLLWIPSTVHYTDYPIPVEENLRYGRSLVRSQRSDTRSDDPQDRMGQSLVNLQQLVKFPQLGN